MTKVYTNLRGRIVQITERIYFLGFIIFIDFLGPSLLGIHF